MKPAMVQRWGKALLASSLCACILSSCDSKQPKEEPASSDWVLSDSLLKQLRIDTATNNPVESEMALTGKITVNEDQAARIFPFVSGIVTSVNVHSGDFVNKGQVLASIRSGEVANFTADVSVAESNLATAKKNYEVQQSFLQSGLASERDVTEAKSEFDKAKAELNKSKAVLSINGGASHDNYVVRSPVPGFVIMKEATENLHWRSDNADPIFIVADLKNVWAMLNIYESDIASIKTGDQVSITTLSYPDKVFTGKIDKIYNMLDPESKVMRARVVIDNPGYLLKPEMFVSVKAKRNINEEMVSIPSRGVVFDNDKYYALVLTHDQHKVAIREIHIVKTVENRAYVDKGLKNGDQIIASKQVFIYESLKK
ncbi:cobalt-zinc-cadmium efflux system membrane fusion protein [Chitinophaga skermanii]|uniref:Cobalt-zinc-cadmium efflux system membrane fusion protein n=1 Tax=Chitinophaga skermanii TaxID=331697 RepID=A0A327Q8X3_9BACT|nr:efflux RND transporter periplasmic adaptor subunit [Chitinophaga skermanii]RAI99712.1 cobalt-zinc-cadmium efflux system membrane fusion protein [Chitinophaga skermanii]